MKFLVAIIAAMAMLLAPSSALAHTATVKADCVNGNAVGTYTHQSFPNNSTADLALWIDGKLAKSGTATGLGSAPKTTTLSTPLPVDNKPHTLYAATAWKADGGGYKASNTVTCPAIQPPPTPTPTPTPPPNPTPTPTPVPPTPPVVPPVPLVPPTPPVGCDGKALIPGVAAPDCTPSPPKPVCPDTSTNRYKITVTPKHAAHGLVTFKLHGPHVRKVRWYVDMERRGISKVRWETLSGKADSTYKVWLFSTEVWGKQLWGNHWVAVRATVGPKGCAHSVSVRLKYFNNDPPYSKG